MRNMSIDELFGFLGALRRFFRFAKPAKKGFWIVELIVAMAILSGMMLVLTKFVWHILLTEQDAVKRMEAVGCISSFIDQKKRISAFKNKKIGDFDLHCKVGRVHRCSCDFPEPIKKKFEKGFNVCRRVEITVSFQSGFGTKREFCMLTGPMRGGGA